MPFYLATFIWVLLLTNHCGLTPVIAVSAQVPRQQYPPPREVVQAGEWMHFSSRFFAVWQVSAGLLWWDLCAVSYSFLGLHGKPRYPDDSLRSSHVGQPAPWFCLEETNGCSMSIASLPGLGKEKRTWFHTG